MSLMGVAGKIVSVLFISLAVTEGISLLYAPAFRIAEDYSSLAVTAIVLAVAGFGINLIVAFGMLSALATNGLYALFLNPMHTFQILVTIPGQLLLLNSWFAMITVVPTFIAFKLFAREEERYLEDTFGAQYASYRKKVLFKFL